MFIDPNAVDYRDRWPNGGEITDAHKDGESIRVSGHTRLQLRSGAILIIDSSRRFVAAAPLGEGGAFTLAFPARHAESWPLSAYAYDPDSNRAVPLKWSATIDFETKSSGIPSMTDRYVAVVREAMLHPYTATSCESDIKTGNNYQSVDLGSRGLSGGRRQRNLFFDHVSFAGKTVLDIGANTGELSRLARRRGASLVDGYEYDPYFVETGRMINGLSGATRVSLFQGDATNPAFYEGKKYDIVLAYSVWVYIHGMLDRLAKVTDVVFFETHTLDHGLEMYTRPMSQHFPHFRLMGHDQERDMKKSRAVLMFAKSEQALAGALSFIKLRVEPYFDNPFFKTHGKTSAVQLPVYAAAIAKAVDRNTKFEGIGGQYFELLLAGYYEYLRDGKVTEENVFSHAFRSAVAEGRLDSGLSYLAEDTGALVAKIAKRFIDIDLARADRWNEIPAVELVPGEKFVFTTEGGATIGVENLDGHHRYFLAQLLGRKTIDAMLQEPKG